MKALDEDTELRELNEKVDTWLRYWRPQLFNYAFNAINLANNPRDRLATHVYVRSFTPARELTEWRHVAEFS